MSTNRQLSGVLVAVLAVVSCGTRSDRERPGGLPVSIPENQELMIGMLELENTPLAIDGKQAQGLLPLVDELGKLRREGKTDEELADVRQQIRAILTKEQLEAIDTMRLDSTIIQKYAQVPVGCPLDEELKPEPKCLAHVIDVLRAKIEAKIDTEE